MDRPITPIEEFERALDRAALTKEEYELIDYIRYTSVFTQPSLIKDLKRPSKPPLLSVLCQICRKIGSEMPDHFKKIISAKMRRLIDKHKTLINWYQKKLKLSDYQLLWLVFFKGVLITIIIFKIF